MTGAFKKLIGAVFRFGLRCLLVFPVLPAFYLMEPFFRLRLGTMHTQRIGHLAGNTDIFFRRRQLEGRPARIMYLFFGWDPCNRQLFDMWLRLDEPGVKFVESRLGARVIFAWRPILNKTRFWMDQRITGTEYYLYNHTRPVLSFTEEEEERGRAGLAEMGIGPDDWFVCFHARDGNYFRKWRPELEEHWQKTDFRNVDITRYLKAAEYIASKGGYALRFGANVEKPLAETGNPGIIDYSTKHRSDFMDIYLCAKCRFFIGSASGPDAISAIFNVPVLSVSHFPYNHAYRLGSDIMVPRLLSTTDGKRRAGFLEAQKAGYYVGWKEADARDPNMHLFDMLDVDPDDIVDGCKDMIESLKGTAPPAEALALQDFYAEQYFSHAADYEYAGKIGARFAMKYRRLILPENDSVAPSGEG
ncbi:MAG: hypothetical protein CMM60_05770 [Rhodospirillaceae bacterium]|nr:hypothetical protein [Rhodospirillaceae bacterium]